ncbi:replication protein RepA [Cupriavidus metallidurans]|nr:replication protein RepA [Cupriavidus metallidurans]
MGFMARVLVQTTLPHSIQNGPRYTRRNGTLTVSITDLSGAGLPYGSYPRLLLIWLTTEACRTKNRQLELGPSLSSFMAELGLMSTGGRWGTIPRLKDQMARLFSAAISATSTSGESTALHHHSGKNLLVADDFDLWWSPHSPDQTTLWRSTVTLSEALFQQVIDRPVPVDLRAVKLLKKSPMALDLYAWSTYRVSYLRRSTLIPWESMMLSLGTGYPETAQGKADFKRKFVQALRKVSTVYPALRASPNERGLLLQPSTTHIPRQSRFDKGGFSCRD